MIRTGDESSASSPCYTLFLEYLGGLVPLLKGRRVSKLRPEFVIYDPKVSGEQLKSGESCSLLKGVSEMSKPNHFL